MAACSPGTETNNKQAKLDSLKSVQADIKEQIAKLEEEIAKENGGKKDSATLVGVEVIKPEVFSSFIEIQGKVDADENVTLSAEMGGTVTKINVKEGDEVRKGQVLAETDNKMIVQGMAEVQTQLDLANNLYQKQKSLWDQKIGTEMQYLQAKTQKEALEKRMASMQEQLDMTRIKSPIDGQVDAVDIKIGQVTAPGMPAIRVVNFNNLKVVGEVPESHASKVKKGNPVLVYFPDTKDSLRSNITFAARVINPLNRTFTVEVNLGNKQEYHPNMITVIKIIDYTKEDAIVVPVKIIRRTEKGDFVYVVDNGKAVKRTVQYSRVYNGIAEITSGLKTGDKLIVSGYNGLNEGESVKF